MRKIFLFMGVSVDGYFEAPGHDLSWHMVDDEFNEFAIAQMKTVGTYLYGHTTYQLMESYWPHISDDPDATPEDIEIGKMMGETPKIVVSHGDVETNWQNVTVLNKGVLEEVKRLKAEDGSDIAIFGSNNLCVSLMQENLVDEFRLMIFPVAIGTGTSLFAGLDKKVPLKLTASRSFGNGNVLNTYILA